MPYYDTSKILSLIVNKSYRFSDIDDHDQIKDILILLRFTKKNFIKNIYMEFIVFFGFIRLFHDPFIGSVYNRFLLKDINLPLLFSDFRMLVYSENLIELDLYLDNFSFSKNSIINKKISKFIDPSNYLIDLLHPKNTSLYRIHKEIIL